MSEDERGFDLFRNALEVLIVPSGGDGGEDAGGVAKFRVGSGVVPSDAKAIAVDSTRGIETQTRIEGLVDDRVGWTCDEMAKLNRVCALED